MQQQNSDESDQEDFADFSADEADRMVVQDDDDATSLVAESESTNQTELKPSDSKSKADSKKRKETKKLTKPVVVKKPKIIFNVYGN